MNLRSRFLAALSVLALLLAACGGSGDATTTTAAPATTSTMPVPEAMAISYDLQAGQTYTFELEMNQTMELTTTGDTTAMEEEGLPGNMVMTVSGPTLITYEVADGPDPDTYEITITSDLSGLEFDVAIDGETAEPGDLPDFAELEPQETTIVVDKQGKPIGGDPMTEDPFSGIFGGFDPGTMGDFGSSGLNPTQFFGPALPDEEVTVGDSWTDTTEIPLFGDDKVTTTVTSTIDRVEELDGKEAMVIETTISTSEIEFDMAEFILALFEGFFPEDPSEEDLAQLEELRNSLRFLFHVDASETGMTTWFDPEAGMALRSEMSGENRMAMDANVPDEATGEMVAFTLDMKVSSDMTYRLVEAPGA
ncbi:MAG TPA: hypothetical protein VF246_04370 [Acidimicrobiia bacterium]